MWLKLVHNLYVADSESCQLLQVCIFAYGQTGSGKTYTMMGNTEHAEQKGHIPRSLEQIFQTSQSLQCQGWKYKMQVSLILTLF